jgi:tol-pal system protein YbgF
MPMHRVYHRSATRVIVMLAAFAMHSAHAGLFDDDEARRQIEALANKVNERVDIFSKAQIELVNQLQSLSDENARLRGQVETLQYELDSARKRLQDFYVDLDGRLRRLETASIPADMLGDAGSADTPAPDPAAETREYEAALNLFKANKIKESANAFEAFAKAHPDNTLTPNAYFWLGNALSTQRDFRRAIDAYRTVVARWPQNSRAAEALLSLASCQQEVGDVKSANATLEALLIKYPTSSAATAARQRLKK